jgi:hypothetical protein
LVKIGWIRSSIQGFFFDKLTDGFILSGMNETNRIKMISILGEATTRDQSMRDFNKMSRTADRLGDLGERHIHAAKKALEVGLASHDQGKSKRAEHMHAMMRHHYHQAHIYGHDYVPENQPERLQRAHDANAFVEKNHHKLGNKLGIKYDHKAARKDAQSWSPLRKGNKPHSQVGLKD